MSKFDNFNPENKLRIPLSAYAAQIIDNDCKNFYKKRTTLINLIILNFHLEASCSISLKLKNFESDLSKCLGEKDQKRNEDIISKILSEMAKKLSEDYTVHKESDVNWQITLNKKVKELLTLDPHSSEEKYYKNRPGRYVKALLEEYALQPYHIREKIVYKQTLEVIKNAIEDQNILHIINLNGNHFYIKPYIQMTDPLSMYHYLIGYNAMPPSFNADKTTIPPAKVISFRLSRITNIEPQPFPSGEITASEKNQILKELNEKGVQFVSGDTTSIKVWLSDLGIVMYNTRLHLRPSAIVDESDDHIYYFECTETQILYYFFSFGSEAKILSPDSLVGKFRSQYANALALYQ